MTYKSTIIALSITSAISLAQPVHAEIDFSSIPETITFNSQLVDAAEYGDMGMVQALILSGIDPNETGDFGTTALIRATYHGSYDIVKYLLENNANPNIADIGGATPLQIAAREGHDEVVKLLIQKGANVNAKDNEGNTALMKAALKGNAGTQQIIIAMGADVNKTNDNGENALLYAAETKKPELVEQLVASGADVKSVDQEGSSVADIAIRKAEPAVIAPIAKKQGFEFADLGKFIEENELDKLIPASGGEVVVANEGPSWMDKIASVLKSDGEMQVAAVSEFKQGNNYVVIDLGSFKNSGFATKRVDELKSKHSDLFSNIGVGVVSANGSYNVRAGVLDNKAEGDALCKKLAESGTACRLIETSALTKESFNIISGKAQLPELAAKPDFEDKITPAPVVKVETKVEPTKQLSQIAAAEAKPAIPLKPLPLVIPQPPASEAAKASVAPIDSAEPVSKLVAKVEEPKKIEIVKVEPKKDEVKLLAPKTVEVAKVEPKKDEVKPVEIAKVEPLKTEQKAPTPADATKSLNAQQPAAPKPVEVAKTEEPKKIEIVKVEPKKDEVKLLAPKTVEVAKVEPKKDEVKPVEIAKVEPKVEAKKPIIASAAPKSSAPETLSKILNKEETKQLSSAPKEEAEKSLQEIAGMKEEKPVSEADKKVMNKLLEKVDAAPAPEKTESEVAEPQIASSGNVGGFSFFGEAQAAERIEGDNQILIPPMPMPEEKAEEKIEVAPVAVKEEKSTLPNLKQVVQSKPVPALSKPVLAAPAAQPEKKPEPVIIAKTETPVVTAKKNIVPPVLSLKKEEPVVEAKKEVAAPVIAKVEEPKPAPAPAPAPVIAKVEEPKPAPAPAPAPVIAKVEEPKPAPAPAPAPVIAKVEEPKPAPKIIELPKVAEKKVEQAPVIAKLEEPKLQPPPAHLVESKPLETAKIEEKVKQLPQLSAPQLASSNNSGPKVIFSNNPELAAPPSTPIPAVKVETKPAQIAAAPAPLATPSGNLAAPPAMSIAPGIPQVEVGKTYKLAEGMHYVRVEGFGSQEAVREFWGEYSKQAPLANATPMKSVRSNNYAAVVGPFASNQSVGQFCEQVRAKGFPCSGNKLLHDRSSYREIAGNGLNISHSRHSSLFSYETAELAPAADNGGNWFIQLGSYNSSDDAMSKWSSLQAQNVVLRNREPLITGANTRTNNSKYRLRIGNFMSRNNAEEICQDLRRNMVSCILVKDI